MGGLFIYGWGGSLAGTGLCLIPCNHGKIQGTLAPSVRFVTHDQTEGSCLNDT